MKSIMLIMTLIISTSCSTIRKSIIYGGLSGASLGVIGGATLSPDKASKAPNMAVWGSIGALTGAALAYLFYMDDPENRELPTMLQGREAKKENYDLAPVNRIPSVTITPKDSKRYKLETGPLPEHLKGKVQTPFIIEHDIPERVEKLENGKAITIEGHKAWEVDYE
ncbi:hypothetical protein DOM21_14875 [Bacteriovorax stolpii]|uniref:hypothetical protein n=1 Tax=Bacteriovorax stolpii TaxID=960 RepID=UPI00115AA836|nr:hypothetical protein [Bacteriovorax stolpii]QDK42710.1 hypothetical protein DOM21_14875 [Bacteriovorax stolpii]